MHRNVRLTRVSKQRHVTRGGHWHVDLSIARGIRAVIINYGLITQISPYNRAIPWNGILSAFEKIRAKGFYLTETDY